MTKHHLHDALRIVGTLASGKFNLPILSAVHLVNEGSDRISVRFNDLERQFWVSIPGHIHDASSVGVSVKSLRKVLDAWGNDDPMTLTAEPNRLNITGRTDRVRLATFEVDEFPGNLVEKAEAIADPVRVNTVGLFHSVDWVRIAAGPAEGTDRPHLQHVVIEPGGRLWATDGHRVHLRAGTAFAPTTLRIAGRALDALKAALSTSKTSHLTYQLSGRNPELDGDVPVEPLVYGEHLHTFIWRAGDLQVAFSTVTLNDFQMPDIDQVVPSSESYRYLVEIAPVELRETLRMVDKIGGWRTVFGVGGEKPLKLGITAASPEVGDYEGSVKILSWDERTEERAEAAADHRYVTDVLNGMLADTCTIEIADPLTPIVFRSLDGDSTAVVMTMKL